MNETTTAQLDIAREMGKIKKRKEGRKKKETKSGKQREKEREMINIERQRLNERKRVSCFRSHMSFGCDCEGDKTIIFTNLTKSIFK